MSDFRLSFPACVVAGKAMLSTEDLMLLRRYTFAEGVRTPDDVVTLMALNACCPEKCPQWGDYFVEQMASFIVHHCYPLGSLDEINVDWIRQVLTDDGVIHGELEFLAVLHMHDIARHAPASLRMLLLDQLRIAIAEGRGAYARMRSLRSGIGADDVSFVNRILRDRLGQNASELSPAKLALLESIDAHVPAEARHPDWSPFIDTLIPMRTRPARRIERPRRWLHVPDSLFLEEQEDLVA